MAGKCSRTVFRRVRPLAGEGPETGGGDEGEGASAFSCVTLDKLSPACVYAGMKLPNFDRAAVPQEKITRYLLSPTHRVGKSKAAFFEAFGFKRHKWKELAKALRQHVADHSVVETEETPLGTQYVVEGIVLAPDGTSLNVRSAWFIDKGKKEPRFITAHPLKRRRT
jgi:uncharacterized protein DUF6883